MENHDDYHEGIKDYSKEEVEFEDKFREDTCGDGSSDKIKLPRGVYRVSHRKWRARVWHPKLKFDLWLGSFRSSEEAIMAVNKKKAEFEHDGGDNFTGMKLPCGVRRRGYRSWQAMIRHPRLKKMVSLGCYDSPEEAGVAFNRKKVEFEETFGSKSVVNMKTRRGVPDKYNKLRYKESYRSMKKIVKFEESVKMDTCDSELEKSKPPRGVYKINEEKWKARVWHPKLKFDFWLGSYNSYEEAVMAIKKKKAEFQGDGGADIEQMKVPRGVSRRGYHRWQAKIQHPILKKAVSLGCYDSPEEAAIVYEKKKAELAERFKGRRVVNVKTSRGDSVGHKVVQFKENNESRNRARTDTKRVDLSRKVQCWSEDMSACLKHEIESIGREVGSPCPTLLEEVEVSNGRVSKYESKTVGCTRSATGDTEGNHSHTQTKTIEEGVHTNRRSVKFGKRRNSRKRVRLESDASWRPKCRCANSSLSSVAGSENLNRVAVYDKSNYAAVDAPFKLQDVNDSQTSDQDFQHPNSVVVNGESNEGICGFSSELQCWSVSGCSTSFNEAGILDSMNISEGNDTSYENQLKPSHASNFDEAMSLGFMNEFGQLLGQFSVLDESLWLSLPDEDVCSTDLY